MTRDLKVIWEEVFPMAFDSMSDVNTVPNWAEAMLSDGINEYFYNTVVVFMASVLELNCHNVHYT
jgi:hypothetical protein